MPKTTKKTTTSRAKKAHVETTVMPNVPQASIPRFPKLSSDLLERFVPVLILACVALAFLVGVLWQKVAYLETARVQGVGTTAAQQTAPPTVDISIIKGLFQKDLIKFGDDNRKVLFVEMADPSCPYCHIAAGMDSPLNNLQPQFKLVKDGGTYLAPVPEMKKLVDEGKASFVYIYYPGHGNGEMGAKALYCAQEQGKFWQVHDVLMGDKGYEIMNGTDVSNNPTKGPIVKNDKTKSGDLAQFLSSAIDPAFMKSCLDSGKYDNRLADDMVVAKSLNIQGTPGFYVNNTSYPGAYSYNDMKASVDSALQ